MLRKSRTPAADGCSVYSAVPNWPTAEKHSLCQTLLNIKLNVDMIDSSNSVVLFLIAIFVWDKYNKGSEKANLVNQDLTDLVKDWRVWQTKGDTVLSSLWDGDLCKKDPQPLTDSRLKCWWHTGTSFYLVIGPIKKEVVSLSLSIVIFLNFVSKQEVETIKTLAISKLHRARSWVGGGRQAVNAWKELEMDINCSWSFRCA